MGIHQKQPVDRMRASATVGKWRQRFLARGLRGHPRSYEVRRGELRRTEQVAEVVYKTLNTKAPVGQQRSFAARLMERLSLRNSLHQYPCLFAAVPLALKATLNSEEEVSHYILARRVPSARSRHVSRKVTGQPPADMSSTLALAPELITRSSQAALAPGVNIPQQSMPVGHTRKTHKPVVREFGSRNPGVECVRVHGSRLGVALSLANRWKCLGVQQRAGGYPR